MGQTLAMDCEGFWTCGWGAGGRVGGDAWLLPLLADWNVGLCCSQGHGLWKGTGFWRWSHAEFGAHVHTRVEVSGQAFR